MAKNRLSGLFKRVFYGDPIQKYLNEDGRPKTVIATGGGGGKGIGAKTRSEKTLKTYWDYYNGEGTIFASINTTAWNTVMVGYSINSENDNAKKLIKDLFENVDIDSVLLDNVIYTLIFGDSFIEKVRGSKSKQIVELKTVDPMSVVINTDKFGREDTYQQSIQGKLSDKKLTKEDIMHLRFFPKPSEPYGISLIEPSKDTIDRMVSTDESIANAIERHGFKKYIITVGSMEDVPPDSVFTAIKSKFEDIGSKNEFIVPGTIKINTLDEGGIEGIDKYFNYFQTMLIIGLLCPEEALGLGRGILHPDTEILAKGKGYIPISDVKDDDIIMTYNQDTNSLEWQSNLKTWKYNLDEELFNIESQTFNLLCTQDHRVYYRGQHKENFEICQAKDLPSRFEMKVGGMDWKGIDNDYEIIPKVPRLYGNEHISGVVIGEYSEKKVPIYLWLKFLGYYISEGSTSIDKEGSHTISIKQTKQEDLDRIYEDIKDLPFKIHKGDDCIRIYDKQLGQYLYPLGKSFEKYIPEHIKNLPPNKLKIIYDCLMFGDGCQNNYFTSSKQLADDVQEIILKMGYGSSIYIKDNIGKDVIINGEVVGKTNYKQYTVTRNEKNLTPEICIKDSNGHKDMHKLIPYKGDAYCVSVDNGLILSRLNGKCVITGNSTEATSKVKEIMYERFIKHIQHKLATQVKKSIINPVLEENGFDPNIVTMRFNSVTDADEAVKSKWLGNLLRGYPEGEKPLSLDEVRAIFDYPPLQKKEKLTPEGTEEEPNKEPKEKPEEDSDKKPEENEEEPKKESSIRDRQIRELTNMVLELNDEIDKLKEKNDG